MNQSDKKLLAAVLDWRLLLLVGLYLALTLLCTQAPFAYSFIVGKEWGHSSDRPYVIHFNTPESSPETGRWRWTRAQSAIEVPGIGERSLLVSMRVVSHRANWQPGTPLPTVDLGMGDYTTATMTLRQQAARYMFYVPDEALEDGMLRLRLETEHWRNPADARESLGFAISEQFSIEEVSTRRSFVLPDSDLLLWWPVGLVLFWFTLRALSFSPRWSFWLLLPVVLIVPLLLLLTAPRIELGSFWSVRAGVVSLVSAVVCVVVVPPLLRRLDMLPSAAVLRWLLFLVVLSFTLKYAARLYPDSMPGDLQLHVNRYTMTVLGDVYIRAQHRGLPFPFPNGLYVLIAPFTLFKIAPQPHYLFELFNGLLDASTVLLLYLITMRTIAHERVALLAGAIYALTAGGHMVTWFAFSTQVAGQWVTVLLITVLVFRWPHKRDWFTWWVTFMLFVQVFLGHIGQFMNLTLVGLLIIPLLWWRARNEEERRGMRWLLGVGVAAGAFVGLFYYSAFWGLIWEQVTGTLTVGLNEVTEREPVPRPVTAWALWYYGLIIHFGFFPALLAIPGTLMLAASRLRGSILPPLVWLSFLVSASQAMLPFITLNSITTRWLMFSAWAIAITSAWALWRLWQRGGAARVVSLAMAGYVCWITIVVWTEAMALRLPPPEPF